MAKYSFEFKKHAVQAYLNGEGSYAFLSKKFGMLPGRDIRKWVNAYKAFGDAGLRRSRGNQKYTFDFKMSIVELYLSSEISYQDLALRVGITNPVTITKWVNDFKIAGPDVLRARKKALDTSVILSILVDTYFSKISLTMLPVPKLHNTAYVLP